MPSITAGARPTLRHGGWWRSMGAASHWPHARSIWPKATQAIGPNPVPTDLEPCRGAGGGLENKSYSKYMISAGSHSSLMDIIVTTESVRYIAQEMFALASSGLEFCPENRSPVTIETLSGRDSYAGGCLPVLVDTWL
jgi:hypothetical protein